MGRHRGRRRSTQRQQQCDRQRTSASDRVCPYRAPAINTAPNTTNSNEAPRLSVRSNTSPRSASSANASAANATASPIRASGEKGRRGRGTRATRRPRHSRRVVGFGGASGAGSLDESGSANGGCVDVGIRGRRGGLRCHSATPIPTRRSGSKIPERGRSNRSRINNAAEPASTAPMTIRQRLGCASWSPSSGNANQSAAYTSTPMPFNNAATTKAKRTATTGTPSHADNPAATPPMMRRHRVGAGVANRRRHWGRVRCQRGSSRSPIHLWSAPASHCTRGRACRIRDIPETFPYAPDRQGEGPVSDGLPAVGLFTGGQRAGAPPDPPVRPQRAAADVLGRRQWVRRARRGRSAGGALGVGPAHAGRRGGRVPLSARVGIVGASRPCPVGASRPSCPVGASRPSCPVGASRPSCPVGASRPSCPVGASRRTFEPDDRNRLLRVRGPAGLAFDRFLVGDALMVPAMVLAVGTTAVWSFEPSKRRLPYRSPLDALLAGGRVTALRVVVGIGLVFVGLVSLAARGGTAEDLRRAASAVGLAAAGVAVAVGPVIGRLSREAADERRERIRSETRAEVAAHLHDSVLQTLAMIQRNSNDPRRMISLARRQERELRTVALRVARRAVCADDTGACDRCGHGGDRSGARRSHRYGDRRRPRARRSARGLVAAVREATVNAAKHAGVADIAVYIEVEDGQVTAFIRDRGRGFMPAAVPTDRQGIRGSIHARIARLGGTAEISSEPGGGTEVQITAAPCPSRGDLVIRVFVVDDHQLFRSGVKAELGSRVSIVGDAADVESALEGIRESRPDVVLLDVHLPAAVGARSSRRSETNSRRRATSRCRSPTPQRTSSR